MIGKTLKAFSDKVKEVSGVERVFFYPRVPNDLAGYKDIYGSSDINCIIITYDNIAPNYETTYSNNDNTWYDIACKCRVMLSYKDSPDYETSSQFVFDEILDNVFDKFNRQTVVTIDSVYKVRTDVIKEVAIPAGGVIESVELGQLVHYAEWEQKVSYIF